MLYRKLLHLFLYLCVMGYYGRGGLSTVFEINFVHKLCNVRDESREGSPKVSSILWVMASALRLVFTVI